MINEGLGEPSSIDAVTVSDRLGLGDDRVEKEFTEFEIRALRYFPDGREHLIYTHIARGAVSHVPGGNRDPVIRSDPELWEALYGPRGTYVSDKAWDDGKIYEK